MEVENDFSRKSRKYRTQYLDELGKLYGNDIKQDPGAAVKLSYSDSPNPQGISIKSNIT